MAVPKRRTSKAAQGNRRSHHNLGPGKGVQYCPRCNEPVLPHRVCPNCGSYQGRDAIQIKDEEGKGA